ncbi:sarcoplasmic calcium-binding protein 1 [Chironomus tepperi]|uniref:sarcoplasmic calcium-binding protein 1 n=1 Tax=Chironomus tepperi TaxID=113505 RepID=UPI00391EFBCB
MSEKNYTWDKRIEFIVRYMYDIDNNGFLDQKDFDCMALRATIIEGKGDCSEKRLQEYKHMMRNLWEELSDIADFDKDGMITTDEFKEAVRKTCVGKKYAEFPKAMKAFIEANFKIMDINSDGVIGIEEFRYNAIQRLATDDVKIVDDAFNALLNETDKANGGLTLDRYQDLYGDYLGKSEHNPAVYLFGPLSTGDD